MKKITLLVASIFLAGGMAYASENPVFSDNNGKRGIGVDYHNAEPIKFMERGIEFYVFPNGDFDFNTRPQDSHGDYHYKTAGKRGTVIVDRHPVNYGVKIEHDAFGRVRRVGNTFINYDAFDRVSRIGTVYMRYNRFALTQIGGLRIVYDRRGCIIDMFGNVKGYRGSYNDNWNNPRGGGYDYPRGGGHYNDDEDDNGYNSDYYYKNEEKPSEGNLEENKRGK